MSDRDFEEGQSEWEQDIRSFAQFASMAQKLLSQKSMSVTLPINGIIDFWVDIALLISQIFREGNHPLTEVPNADPVWDPMVKLPANEVPFGIPELSFKTKRPWIVPASKEAATFFDNLAEIGIWLKRELGTKPKQISSLFSRLSEELLLATGLDLTAYVNRLNADVLALKREISQTEQLMRKKWNFRTRLGRLNRKNHAENRVIGEQRAIDKP